MLTGERVSRLVFIMSHTEGEGVVLFLGADPVDVGMMVFCVQDIECQIYYNYQELINQIWN